MGKLQWIFVTFFSIFAAAALAGDGAALRAPAGAEAPGQILFIDPASGEIREPSAQDWAQLPRAVAAKRAVAERVLPDGTILLPATAAIHEMSATLAPDGSIETRCSDQPSADWN